MTNPCSGYVEGFYGRLLDWRDRRAIVDTLARNKLGSYLYAPKEDVRHRYRWRQAYDDDWHRRFSEFCTYANERNVSIVAGVAPGLDFDFGHLAGGEDFSVLVTKCRKLIQHGASTICLLMDDIDADFHKRNGGIEHEGEAHALLANALANSLRDDLADTADTADTAAEEMVKTIQVVPRIYADELSNDAGFYLPHFIDTLDTRHTLIYCGIDIVTETVQRQDISNTLKQSDHKLIIWDNLYANDYCPRRLFLGPWSGREHANPVLLNPTGMVHTDCLLIDVMAATLEQQQSNADTQSSAAIEVSKENTSIVEQAWRSAMQLHQVPEPFYTIAAYFHHPVFNTRQWQPIEQASQEQFDAIEHLLWRWKTPLSREWYPFIMGLKHDLLINQGRLSDLRIQKTQPPALTTHLLK